MFGSCLSIKIFCRLKYTYRYQYKTSDIKWNHLKDVKGYVNQTSFKYGQVITPPPTAETLSKQNERKRMGHTCTCVDITR